MRATMSTEGTSLKLNGKKLQTIGAITAETGYLLFAPPRPFFTTPKLVNANGGALREVMSSRTLKRRSDPWRVVIVARLRKSLYRRSRQSNG
jgi:hypothetical protein